MQGDSAEEGAVPLHERIYVSSRAYSSVSSYFAHWSKSASDGLDANYSKLIGAITETDDRYSFDMHMMEFMASFSNGHTRFNDLWLIRRYGQASPVDIRYDYGKWIIFRSQREGINPGDVIGSINGISFEEFYASKMNRVSASGERECRSRFSEMYFLYPREFVLDIGGKPFDIIREKASYFKVKPIEGYWLEGGRTAYISIRQLSKSIEEDAIGLVKEFLNAKRMIIDLRGCVGGATPTDLIKMLMDAEFGFWRESTPLTLPLFKFYSEFLSLNKGGISSSLKDKLSLSDVFSSCELTWDSERYEPNPNGYRGELFIIVDRYCRSAGEDFVLPFKESGRAVIVGETTMGTSGQPYTFTFDNGMQLFVGTKKVLFPDGSRFEGIGIRPDVSIKGTLEDVSRGVDTELEYCLS